MPTNSALQYELLAEWGHARAAHLTLPHGMIKTPVFMPVGTNGTVKGLTSKEIEDLGFGIILGNTYHLGNHPGLEVMEKVGGLHKFMNWNRNLLTDSGGFQMVSLLRLAHVTEEGVVFQSPNDGSQMTLTPEYSMRIQNAIGADIIMALDDVVATMTEAPRMEEAMYRTLRWVNRCIEAHARPHSQNLFGIVQGGLDLELRRICIQELLTKNLPGYAIGGLSGGEAKDKFWRIVKLCTDLLPKDKPRYLMGVGNALDMVVCAAMGVDMFDCVYPSRTARLGTALTKTGNLNLKAATHRYSYVPIDSECPCMACRHYTRAYLHFLCKTESIACQLLTVHNLCFQKRLMGQMHDAVVNRTFPEFVREFVVLQFPKKDYPVWVREALHSIDISL